MPGSAAGSFYSDRITSYNVCYTKLLREATARGIAWLAAGGPAGWSREGEGHVFMPGEDKKLQARYQRFSKALKSML